MHVNVHRLDAFTEIGTHILAAHLVESLLNGAACLDRIVCLITCDKKTQLNAEHCRQCIQNNVDTGSLNMDRKSLSKPMELKFRFNHRDWLMIQCAPCFSFSLCLSLFKVWHVNWWDDDTLWTLVRQLYCRQ